MSIVKKVLFLLTLLYTIVFIWQIFKPTPAGLSYESDYVLTGEENVELLVDLKGEGTSEYKIYDEILKHIKQSHDYILLDMFLFNSHLGKGVEPNRKIADEIAQAILDKINNSDNIKIDFITDPINTVYGGARSEQLDLLRSAGVNVIETDRTKMRDSNYFYSPLWRIFFQWFGNSTRTGLLPHPFSGEEPKVSIRSYLDLLNFKANHRKVFMADSYGEMVSIITSANLHDGSSYHSNVALKVKGDFWKSVYESEQAVAKMSGGELSKIKNEFKSELIDNPKTTLKLLTEKKIKESIVNSIKQAKKGNKIFLAMFYLSDRKIINSLIDAAEREVEIQIILDPNKDAFGFEKGGIPNRQIASELLKRSDNKIQLRWFNTHGEQFHSKILVIDYSDESKMFLGSANYTRRNLDNLNLEANVMVVQNKNSELRNEFKKYFDKIWLNTGDNYTVAYEKYADDSAWKKIVYRLQDASGMCSF